MTEKIVPVKQGIFLLINLALKNLVAGIIQIICVYQLFNYLISSPRLFFPHCFPFAPPVSGFFFRCFSQGFLFLTFLTAMCQSQLICNKCKSVTAQVVISTELTHASTQVTQREKTQIYNIECKRKGVCAKKIQQQLPPFLPPFLISPLLSGSQ